MADNDNTQEVKPDWKTMRDYAVQSFNTAKSLMDNAGGALSASAMANAHKTALAAITAAAVADERLKTEEAEGAEMTPSKVLQLPLLKG